MQRPTSTSLSKTLYTFVFYLYGGLVPLTKHQVSFIVARATCLILKIIHNKFCWSLLPVLCTSTRN